MKDLTNFVNNKTKLIALNEVLDKLLDNLDEIRSKTKNNGLLFNDIIPLFSAAVALESQLITLYENIDDIVRKPALVEDQKIIADTTANTQKFMAAYKDFAQQTAKFLIKYPSLAETYPAFFALPQVQKIYDETEYEGSDEELDVLDNNEGDDGFSDSPRYSERDYTLSKDSPEHLQVKLDVLSEKQRKIAKLTDQLAEIIKETTGILQENAINAKSKLDLAVTNYDKAINAIRAILRIDTTLADIANLDKALAFYDGVKKPIGTSIDFSDFLFSHENTRIAEKLTELGRAATSTVLGKQSKDAQRLVAELTKTAAELREQTDSDKLYEQMESWQSAADRLVDFVISPKVIANIAELTKDLTTKQDEMAAKKVALGAAGASKSNTVDIGESLGILVNSKENYDKAERNLKKVEQLLKDFSNLQKIFSLYQNNSLNQENLSGMTFSDRNVMKHLEQLSRYIAAKSTPGFEKTVGELMKILLRTALEIDNLYTTIIKFIEQGDEISGTLSEEIRQLIQANRVPEDPKPKAAKVVERAPAQPVMVQPQASAPSMSTEPSSIPVASSEQDRQFDEWGEDIAEIMRGLAELETTQELDRAATLDPVQLASQPVPAPRKDIAHNAGSRVSTTIAQLQGQLFQAQPLAMPGTESTATALGGSSRPPIAKKPVLPPGEISLAPRSPAAIPNFVGPVIPPKPDVLLNKIEEWKGKLVNLHNKAQEPQIAQLVKAINDWRNLAIVLRIYTISLTPGEGKKTLQAVPGYEHLSFTGLSFVKDEVAVLTTSFSGATFYFSDTKLRDKVDTLKIACLTPERKDAVRTLAHELQQTRDGLFTEMEKLYAQQFPEEVVASVAMPAAERAGQGMRLGAPSAPPEMDPRLNWY